MVYVLKTEMGERTAECPEDMADLLMEVCDHEMLARTCAEREITTDKENNDGYVADLLTRFFLGRFLGRGGDLREELALIIECQAGYGPGFCGPRFDNAVFEVVWRDEEGSE